MNAQDDVKIGTQVWTSKNLDVSTFRNGDPIPEVKTRDLLVFRAECVISMEYSQVLENVVNGGVLRSTLTVLDMKNILMKPGFFH